jgi:hypothetical protein
LSSVRLSLSLKVPGFQTLNLRLKNQQMSNRFQAFAFKFNLYHSAARERIIEALPTSSVSPQRKEIFLGKVMQAMRLAAVEGKGVGLDVAAKTLHEVGLHKLYSVYS